MSIRFSAAAAVVVACCGVAHAGVVGCLDFGEFVNGEAVSSSMGVAISDGGVGPGLGPAVFDSDPLGPNMGGGDGDLLVGLGNILIAQNNSFPDQTVAGIFDTPNDEEDGGEIVFDFASPIQPLSIDLIDINGNGPAWVTLVDGATRTRTYDVPMNWTHDVLVAPLGWDTLDLTTLAGQLGEGGATATASEMPGFDPADVVQIRVEFDGSGGLTNLKWVPAPGTAVLAGLAGLAGLRRRR